MKQYENTETCLSHQPTVQTRREYLVFRSGTLSIGACLLNTSKINWTVRRHPLRPHFARWGHSVGKCLLSVVVRLPMTNETMGSDYNAKIAKVGKGADQWSTLLCTYPTGYNDNHLCNLYSTRKHPTHSSHQQTLPIRVIWSHSFHMGQAFLMWLPVVEGEHARTVGVACQEAQVDYECRLQYFLTIKAQDGSSILKRIFCNLTHSYPLNLWNFSCFGRPEPCFFHFRPHAWIRWIEGSPMTFHMAAMNFKTQKGNKWRNPYSWQSLSLSLSPWPSRKFSCSAVAFTCFADLTREAFASFNMRGRSKDP